MSIVGERGAVFLDRDGVLIKDYGPLSRVSDIELCPGVCDALQKLQRAGYLLICVSNQAIVARGILSEREVGELQAVVESRIVEGGGPRLDGFHFCPHHPHADVEAYRVNCDYRKPKPGMLQRAIETLGLNPERCFMVGDRYSDIAAGHSAGCKSYLVETGQHLAPPIVTNEPLTHVRADAVFSDLGAVANHILQAQVTPENVAV